MGDSLEAQVSDAVKDLTGASEDELRQEVRRLRGELRGAKLKMQGLEQKLQDMENLEAQFVMAQVETVEAFVTTIDAKDPYTSGHSRRVRDMSLQIGASLALDRNTMQRLLFASLLHDVGKVGVSGASLRKTSRLDDEEYLQLKQHPIIGEGIVRKIEYFAEIAPLVRWHHERYDGKGYPDKLQGEEIPIESAIVCAADAYDAMTSKRPYGSPKTHSEAVEEIARHSGTQFSPIVVDGLQRVTSSARLESVVIDESDFADDFEIPDDLGT